MRRLVLLVAVCACNEVYGLDPTQVRPADQLTDTDRDGFADVNDNCPKDFNDTQADEDGDGIGNPCDNCPLVANADQQDLGDGDGVGDRCDPHPTVAHDCMIVFDSFDDPDQLAMHWSVTEIGSTGVASTRAIAGEVELQSSPQGSLAISVLGDDGNALSDRLEAQATTRFVPTTAAVLWIGTNTFSASDGEWFGVSNNSLTYTKITNNASSTIAVPGSLVPPLTDDMYIRLDVTSPTSASQLYYLVDWGLSLKTARSSAPLGLAGAPSIIVSRGSAVVTGFTAYKNVGKNATCPAPMLR